MVGNKLHDCSFAISFSFPWPFQLNILVTRFYFLLSYGFKELNEWNFYLRLFFIPHFVCRLKSPLHYQKPYTRKRTLSKGIVYKVQCSAC